MTQTCSIRRAALRLLLGGSVLALAGCGRKGAPQPPLDVDPCYPRHYPMDEAAKQACAQKEIYAREHPPQPRPKRGQRRSAPASPPPAQPATPPATQTPGQEPTQTPNEPGPNEAPATPQ